MHESVDSRASDSATKWTTAAAHRAPWDTLPVLGQLTSPRWAATSTRTPRVKDDPIRSSLTCHIIVAVVALGLTRPASALAPDVTLSAQLALAAPFGELSGDTYYVSYVYAAKVPLRLRAGWRPTASVEFGVSVTLAVVAINDALTEDRALVSGNALGAGLDFELHPLRGRPLDPWIGIGIGVSTLAGQLDEGRIHERWSGFVIPRIEVGVSTRSVNGISIGSYTAVEVGRFTRYSMSAGPDSGSHHIPNPSLHYWLEFGLRVSMAGSAS